MVQFLAALLFMSLSPIEVGNRAYFPAVGEQFSFEGRVEQGDRLVHLHYGMSGARFRFTGTSLTLILEDDAYGGGNTIGVRIDGGVEIPLVIPGDATPRIHVVALGLEPGGHEAHVYRRNDAWHGRLTWHGVALDPEAELLQAPDAPKLKLEFYGDSVLAGGGAEMVGFEATPDDQAQDRFYRGDVDLVTNAYWGYGALTARELGAQAHIQGVGGMALLDGTGWFGEPNLIGLESTFDSVSPIPEYKSPWDFSKFVPDAVVIGIGQNCWRNGDPSAPEHRKRWISTYGSMLETLKAAYPKAQFLLITTILGHDPVWDEMLDEVARQSGERVHRHRFKRNGAGTPGHPRLAEQQEMAKEIVPVIRALLDLPSQPR